MRNRVACVFACLLLSLLGVSSSVFGQSDVASVTGRVLDPNGAVIVEATVAARNVDTGVETVVQTNEDGIYRFANLSPGNYEFTVSKRGFKEIVKPGVPLHLADTISMNFNMVVGALTEKVTVEAGAMMINTTDASVSTVVDQSYVKNMTLNGRSFQDLILLTPGVVTQTPQNSQTAVGVTGEFSVNGQRPEENYYTVDGVNANAGATAGQGFVVGAGASGSLGASTALGTTQALVSVDELQEFRVQSSTYSAEYGRTPGGQFAFETKSGTNQLHGSAYDYLRNNFFDAKDWFNDFLAVREPSLRQNDFGGTLGGPVGIPSVYNGNDKTFFFFNYEGLRLMAPQAANVSYVPDAALRASAPGTLQQALNAFPVANGPDLGSGLAEYIASWANPDSIDSTSARLDHVINDKSRLFFRFSNTDSKAVTRQFYLLGGGVPSVNDISSYTMRTYTGGASNIFGPRLSNELRVNYSSNETTDRDVIDGFGGGTPADLAKLAGVNGQAEVTIFLNLNPLPNLIQHFQAGTQKQWNLVDTVSLSVGRQQFKFGADYRRSMPFFIPVNPGLGYAYFSSQDVQNDNASVLTSANAQGYPLYQNTSVFAQDEWRATQRLTLSMGLRWELNPAPGVTQGPRPYTILFTPDPNTWGLAPLGTALWKTTWYNFAPRLGASYLIRNTPGRETVLRAGGGVFFDTGQQGGSLGMVNSPGFFALDIASGSFSIPVSGQCAQGQTTPCIPSLNPPQPGNTVATFWPHLQLPYTLQWNASLEQALGKSQTITISYVGAHGARLLKTDVFFPPSNSTAFQFNVTTNGLTSDYGSSQVQYRRRLAQGLTALASYTWSHCIDYNSQNYLFGYQRGNCDFDVRHNFSSAFSYDLPNVGHGGLVHALLHHWGLDDRFTARTGFPLTFSGNQVFDPATGKEQFSGVDLVPNQPIYVTQCQDPRVAGPALIPCPGGRGINPNAFTSPSGSLGNAPRNFVRGLGAWQMDLAIRREFPLVERLKLQFRTEAFNVFNHPNFGTIATFLGQNTFGEAQQTLASSLGILSPIYQMGGARSMQFALKLIF